MKIKKKTKVETTVVLELTEQEAECLALLVGKGGWNTSKELLGEWIDYREYSKCISPLYVKLRHAGVHYRDTAASPV